MDGEELTRAVPTQDGRVLIEQEGGSCRPAASRTDRDRVRTRSGEEIEAATSDPDAPPLDEAFWQETRVVFSASGAQETQPSCAPSRTCWWFRARGPGYQTRMNAVLRAYVEAQKRGGR